MKHKNDKKQCVITGPYLARRIKNYGRSKINQDTRYGRSTSKGLCGTIFQKYHKINSSIEYYTSTSYDRSEERRVGKECRCRRTTTGTRTKRREKYTGEL